MPQVHLTFKLLWRDFNKEFEDKLIDFRTHVKTVEKQAGISNMIEAAEERALVQFEKNGESSRSRMKGHVAKLTIVDRRNRLLSQLSPISCVNKHLREREKLHKGTGSWLTETVELVDWVTTTCSDCLWCYGIRTSAEGIPLFTSIFINADFPRV